MTMERSRDTGIFIMGPTASGKMQVANFILGFPAFQLGMTPAKPMFSVLGGRVVAVITGSGLGNQECSTCQSFIDSVELFLNRISVQIRVFLLVLKFNEPLTSEDMQIIQAAKNILGENVLRDYTNIIFRGGRDFERHHRIEDFKYWCLVQPDENLRMLLRECQGRAQLLGNSGRFEADLQGQQQKLIDDIDRLSEQHRNVGYCLEDYERAHDSRQKELVSSLKEEFETRTYSIWIRLDDIRRQWEPWEQLAELNLLRTEAEDLVNSIQRDDRGTGMLRDALLRAEISRRSVQEAISDCRTLTPFNNRINRAQGDISNNAQRLRRQERFILLLAGVCLCLLLCVYNKIYGFSLLIGWLSFWTVVCQFFS